MKRKKTSKKPEFDVNDRDFNAKAWYVQDIAESKGDAVIEICYNDKLIREFIMPAYKIWNIPAHFADIVDSELTKDDKERGYKIALSTGLEGI